MKTSALLGWLTFGDLFQGSGLEDDTGRICGGAQPKVASPPKVTHPKVDSPSKVASGDHLSPGPPDGHGHFRHGELTFGDHINGVGGQRGEEWQKLPNPLSDRPASGRRGPVSERMNGSNAKQQGHDGSGRPPEDEQVFFFFITLKPRVE